MQDNPLFDLKGKSAVITGSSRSSVGRQTNSVARRGT